jgi:O-antigen/teichoic acid export membrane protein
MSSFSFKNLLKGSFWVVLATTVIRITGFIVLPILARLLSPEELGLYNLVYNTIQTGDGLSRIGVDVSMHRDGSQYESKGSESTGRLFGVGSIIMIGVAILLAITLQFNHEFIAKYLLGEPKIEPWISLISLTILLTAIGNAPWIYLVALHAFRVYSLRLSIISIAGAVITIGLTYLYGLSGSIWGLVFTALIQVLLGWVLTLPILKEKKINLRFDNFILQSRSILGFGLPFYASNFLSSFISLPLLGYVSRVGGLDQLGFLRVAQSLSQFISFLPTAIAPVLVSALSANLASQHNESQKIKSLHLRILWTLMILIAAIACFSLDYLIPALFGSSYIQAILLSRLTIWITVIGSISGIFSQYIVSAGKTRTIMIVQTTGLAINAIFAILLIPIYSSTGLLMAQCTQSLFTAIAYIQPALTDLKPADKKSLVFLLMLSIGLIALSFGIPFIINNFILTLTINIICCIITIFFVSTKIFTSEEKYLFISSVKAKIKSY